MVLRPCERMPCHAGQGDHTANQAVEQEEQNKRDGEQRDASRLVKRALDGLDSTVVSDEHERGDSVICSCGTRCRPSLWSNGAR